MYVLADDTSSFGAKLVGDFSPIELGPRAGYSVAVRASTVDPTGARFTGRARLSIAGQSGYPRVFRVLVFKRR